MFHKWSSVLSVLSAGEMLGGSGTAYFAMCISFFIDENHVAWLPPKLLPVGHTAAFLFGNFATLCAHVIM